MDKKCLKCHHIADVPGLETDACPKCGAIYAKVEEYLRNNPAATSPTRRGTPLKAASDRDAFVEQLRMDSLYPTARWWVNLVHTIITALCVLLGIGVLVALFKGEVAGALIVGIGAILLWLGSRIMKELMQMMIDMCDASVRTAFQQERQTQ